MTDEQIIKALDLCANTKGCRECPLHSMHSANCIKKLQNNALALITRKNSELADLNNLLKLSNDIQNEFCEKIDEQKAEIERLKAIGKDEIEYRKALEKYSVSFAIKKFAERLCEGRVSNDPVVIAVKAELKMTEQKG